MWIVDTALRTRQEQSRPIRVGIVGAGFMGQGLTNQVTHSTPGMRVVAISNRRVERAVGVLEYAGWRTSLSGIPSVSSMTRPLAQTRWRQLAVA
jgi:predicted homoserine dehydrogenase-like protein